MGEQTEAELLAMLRQLIDQDQERVTGPDLDRLEAILVGQLRAFESRSGERLDAVEDRLGALEHSTQSASGRIGPLEVALARVATGELADRRRYLWALDVDDGRSLELGIKLPSSLRRVLAALALALLTGASLWIARQLGVPLPLP